MHFRASAAPMTELESASVVFLILLGATGIGVIVLRLLTASAKTVFDTNTDDIRGYATQLIQLDDTLRQYGVAAGAPRQLLRAYTAAAIASTWPNERPPPGNYYPVIDASEGNPRNL